MDQSFQVIVNSFVHSPGEWKRILDADAAGAVAQLADEERLVAKRLGVEEKEVADKIKAGQYGELKLKAKGLSLGEETKTVLDGLGPDYRLVAVLWENSQARWVLRIKAADSIANVPIPGGLADDVVEAGSEQDLDRLKNLVLFGVGRQELIFER
jgi:hypothetical protein